MKKTYQNPVVEIEVLDAQDILTGSNDLEWDIPEL